MVQSIKMTALGMALALLGGCQPGTPSAQPSAASVPTPEVPVEQQGCDHAQVLVLAKKLVALKIRDASEPADKGGYLSGMSGSGFTAEAYRQAVPESSRTLLNSMRAAHIDTSGVAMSEVAVLLSPDSAAADATSQALRAKGILHACTAIARIRLKPALHAHLQSSEGGRMLLSGDGPFIDVPIFYATSAGERRQLQVEMAISNPLMDTMLTVLLRTHSTR